MPKRFLTEEQLTFAVGGRPLSRGRSNGHGVSGGVREFGQLVKLATKMAMVEQGWKKTNEAVYAVIVIYLAAHYAERMHYTIAKERLANDKVFPLKAPNVDRMAKIVISALSGLAIEQPKQVVGLTVVKKFAKEPRVEVLIGKPKSFKEMSYDLRNA